MSYVLDYCVVSFFFLLTITVYYFWQSRVKTIRYRLYGILLILGLCSIVLDFLMGYVDAYADSCPLWLLYLGNILFLTCVQASGPVFLFYTLVITGKYNRLSSFTRFLVHIPFATILLLLFLSPFGTIGIFYHDESHKYLNGATHAALYASIALYLLMSFFLVLFNRRTISRRKRMTIYGFLAITVVAMYVQMNNPTYLVNTTANAIALTMIYFALQLPSDNMDAMTMTFNASTLSLIINDYYEQGASYSTIVFPLKSLHLVNHTYGTKCGDSVIKGFADNLKAAFPKSSIVRATGDAFIVVRSGKAAQNLTREELVEINRRIPHSITVDGIEIPFTFSVIGINSVYFSAPNEVADFISYVVKQYSSSSSRSSVFLVDEDYKDEYILYYKTEAALEKAIRNNALEVYYQPIHEPGGKMVALEALCRIFDEELGALRPDMFITIAEQNGSIFKLTEQVLEKVCRFIVDNNINSWRLEHIGVNLSIMQFAQGRLSESIIKIINENSSVCAVSDFYKFVKSTISEINDENEDKKYILECHANEVTPKS